MRSGFERQYQSYAFWAIVVLAVIGATLVVAPFFGAIMWAIVLSVLMAGTFQRLRKRWSANVASGLAVLLTILIIVIPIGLVGALMYAQVNHMAKDLAEQGSVGSNGWSVDDLTHELDRISAPIVERLGLQVSIKDWFDENRPAITKSISQFAGKVAKSALNGAFTMIVALLTMFFMLRDGHRLKTPALELIPLPREKSEHVITRMSDTIRAVFVGVVLVSVIQGTLAGLAYWAAGAPQPFVWAVATTVLCSIPLLGAPIVYFPISVALLAQGHYVAGIALLAFCGLVVSQIDNILRPIFIGAKTGLHPMAIFFSLLGGVLALGPIGIMAGPVLLTLILALQDIVRESRATEPLPEPSAPLPPSPGQRKVDEGDLAGT